MICGMSRCTVSWRQSRVHLHPLASRKWCEWSEKPPGQDYVQPSVEYFSLGKTRQFKGDANQPGVMKAMLEVGNFIVQTPSLQYGAGQNLQLLLNVFA